MPYKNIKIRDALTKEHRVLNLRQNYLQQRVSAEYSYNAQKSNIKLIVIVFCDNYYRIYGLPCFPVGVVHYCQYAANMFL